MRRALLDAGLAFIAEPGGGDALALRELARRVAVSPTAVYRHFPDKAALLAALAGEGLAQLGAAQRAAFAARGGGVGGFAATGVAYVRFALDHPALFRLTFQHRAPGGPAMPAGHEDDAMALLLANARAFAPAGIDPELFALQAWSLVHGLAMLLLDGQLSVESARIKAVVDAMLLTQRGAR